MRAPRPPLLVLLLLAAGGALAGCSSDDDVRPSPIPPGYAMLLQQRGGAPPRPRRGEAGGDTLDELLAVVDGEVLTRREVLRRLRLPERPDPDRDVEEEILQARKEWAQQRIVIGAARRAGLQIPESAVDKIVEEQIQIRIKRYEEDSGQRLSRDDYLRNRGLTYAEFREQIKGAVIYEFYLQKLLKGVGKPTRPEVDWDVSPAEVRRIYYDHREAFDQKPGVRFALFQLRIERFETGERDIFEAEEAAQEQAEALAAGYRQGQDPAALAGRFGVADDDWTVSKDFVERFLQPQGNKWLFDPQRRVRDAVIFNDPTGPLVLGVAEIRPGRARPLEEVYDDIVERIQVGKQARLAAQLAIDQLNRGSVIWPPELADELLDDAHALLDQIATDDVLGGARLK
jgi:hypothetical protein